MKESNLYTVQFYIAKDDVRVYTDIIKEYINYFGRYKRYAVINDKTYNECNRCGTWGIKYDPCRGEDCNKPKIL